MIAEVLIFVPSVAYFRKNYLLDRLERAEIASFSVLVAPNGMLNEDVKQDLLRNAGVENIILFRSDRRELVLSNNISNVVDETYDLRETNALSLIMDVLRVMVTQNDRFIRLLGNLSDGTVIEVTMKEALLRAAIYDYGTRILVLSLLLSIMTAFGMIFAIRAFIIRPMQHIMVSMRQFQSAPQDCNQIIEPSATIREFYETERTLADMQQQLNQALRERKNMVALGEAVSKINHDLRNMLTTAQLLADRVERSEDPSVQRVAPKLVNSLSRAINLAETTLTFGRTEEPAPELTKFSIRKLIDEVIEAERLSTQKDPITFDIKCPKRLHIWADRDQIFRVISNITRNARQVLQTRPQGGTISLIVKDKPSTWAIIIKDNGSGMPEKARTNMFMPFKGSARAGGFGLGLAIAAELVAAHDGTLILLYSSDQGTAFEISLPKEY